MMEMDGAGDGTVARSATSTPFKERLEAVKQTPRSDDVPAPISSDEQQRIEKSMALKNLLNVQSPSPTIRTSGHSPFPVNMNGYERNPGPPSVGQYAPPPQAFVERGYGEPRQQQQPHMTVPGSMQIRGEPDVKSMEADLRKLLKLS